MSVPAFSQNKKRSEKIRRLEHVLRGNEITLPDFIRTEIVFESYSPGELIRTANDNVKTMSVMFSGKVLVFNSSVEGREFAYAKEQTMTLLGDLEYLSGNYSYASTVIARTKVELGSISFELFDRWMDNKDFRDYVVYCIANKAFTIVTDQAKTKFYSPVQRVSNILLKDLRHADFSDELYVVECTHQDLALLTGLSLRTINRAVQELVLQNLISVRHGKILIQASELNRLIKILE